MWHDIKQNTDEWLQLRSGKVTGSSIDKIMAHYGKALGQPAKDYAANIAVEEIIGGRIDYGSYSNQHTERGHDEEPIARLFYEEETFVDVKNGGFFDNGRTGCSPDGIIGSCGLIEIKSSIPSIHYKRVQSGTYDSSYKWQLIFNLMQSSMEWIDFVSFCSFFPENHKLYISRINIDDVKEEIKMIQERLEIFFDLVDKIKSDLS